MKETIFGPIVAKANPYVDVPGSNGRRIIKDSCIRDYEQLFDQQCIVYRNRCISGRFRLSVKVWHSNNRYDLDNSLKTLLDCLQSVNAITNDNLCYSIEAEKFIDASNPRIEFSITEINKQTNLF